jgi:hypothetical protein
MGGWWAREERAHVPYRNAKLTHLLQDSIGLRAHTHAYQRPGALRLTRGGCVCLSFSLLLHRRGRQDAAAPVCIAAGSARDRDAAVAPVWAARIAGAPPCGAPGDVSVVPGQWHAAAGTRTVARGAWDFVRIGRLGRVVRLVVGVGPWLHPRCQHRGGCLCAATCRLGGCGSSISVVVCSGSTGAWAAPGQWCWHSVRGRAPATAHQPAVGRARPPRMLRFSLHVRYKGVCIDTRRHFSMPKHPGSATRAPRATRARWRRSHAHAPSMAPTAPPPAMAPPRAHVRRTAAWAAPAGPALRPAAALPQPARLQPSWRASAATRACFAKRRTVPAVWSSGPLRPVLDRPRPPGCASGPGPTTTPAPLPSRRVMARRWRERGPQQCVVVAAARRARLARRWSGGPWAPAGSHAPSGPAWLCPTAAPGLAEPPPFCPSRRCTGPA